MAVDNISTFSGWENGKLKINEELIHHWNEFSDTKKQYATYKIIEKLCSNYFITETSLNAYLEKCDPSLQTVIRNISQNKFSAAQAQLHVLAKTGNAAAINNLAFVIEDKKITATEADFECAGISMPEGDCYAQATALYRVAAIQGNATAINNLAFVIEHKKITALC